MTFDLSAPPVANPACALPELTEWHGRESDRVFFPPDTDIRKGVSRWAEMAAAEAKAVCGGCPDLAPCREWILTRENAQGFLEEDTWGKLTKAERAGLLRDKKRRQITNRAKGAA